ncbi:MAG: hypothetical protein M1818_002426 [Claussenomyces sp. TS43310]|nr:MAG: hypothetical protein M1818_002426 [Claussenomyces sp. TS43310]
MAHSMHPSLLVFLLTVFSLNWALVLSLDVATVPAGTIQGTSCNTSKASAFLSVPYAQPPVGNLRFAPPQPYNGNFSGGTYQATVAAPSCIQFGTEFIESGPTSEDCLYLDIWVPPNATGISALPVKVWIYGGANNGGGISNPLYNGCNLAMDNTLVVSINYRLGPLGFLALQSAGIAGNMAIQDILRGLQWVQSNIAAFGGDPKRVLLWGQSAGADNTYVISTLPQAPSLFRAAIAESSDGRLSVTNASIQADGARYAQSLGCGISDIACLRSLPLVHLNASDPSGSALPNPNASSFGAYVDGQIIPAQPSEVGTQVPAIFGSTTREATLLIAPMLKDPTNLTAADYYEFLQKNYGAEIASLITKEYPVSAFNSTPYPAFAAIETVVTEVEFTCQAYRALQTAAKKGVPVWTYLSDLTPTCPWYAGMSADSLSSLGPTHTSEIPLVFGNLYNLPLPDGTCNLTVAEQEVSATLISAWTSMAASGQPSPEGGLFWPGYNASQSYHAQGLKIGNSTTTGVIDYSACEFWDSINSLVENAADSNASSPVNSSTGSGSTATASASASASSSSSTSSLAGAAGAVSAGNAMYLTALGAAVGLVILVRA